MMYDPQGHRHVRSDPDVWHKFLVDRVRHILYTLSLSRRMTGMMTALFTSPKLKTPLSSRKLEKGSFTQRPSGISTSQTNSNIIIVIVAWRCCTGGQDFGRLYGECPFRVQCSKTCTVTIVKNVVILVVSGKCTHP